MPRRVYCSMNLSSPRSSVSASWCPLGGWRDAGRGSPTPHHQGRRSSSVAASSACNHRVGRRGIHVGYSSRVQHVRCTRSGAPVYSVVEKMSSGGVHCKLQSIQSSNGVTLNAM
ncbi:uncharacterized protein LOC123430236 [Hordeum vulgare subsp. vulgare]|uniref:Predicted protein n=1 Tax=Hordeum vulgare subsp. vulgare TaxID=112509 RepID=F2D824_HORVV|nr:uncharacterized protein LOC123430236 [Hordeum vulgare subsp. vulgare]BAJ91245.1 predicted protein [Hordeum vulgare subsp. vulgare]